MEVIIGEYAEAKVFSNDMDEYARAQVKMICDNKVSEGSKIRIMPDVHPGKIGPIGLTMTIKDKVIPGLLGIDIGCGVSMVNLNTKKIEFEKLDTIIRDYIPAGFKIRNSPHNLADNFNPLHLHCIDHINVDKAMASLGTLGGGNHFIEIDSSVTDNLSLVVHSGSRHLGVEVAKYYMDEGAKELKKKGIDIPYEMTYLEGDLFNQYIEDIKIIQDYAKLNREIIIREITKRMKIKSFSFILSIAHNYIEDTGEEMILRKGAISAKFAELVVIPINMRDGVIVGKGLGNSDWNCSAPHGSGRLYSREDTKNKYTVSAFKKDMRGIYSSCINSSTLDESPFAYRKSDIILDSIKPTVGTIGINRPVYSYKAGGK